LYITIYLYFYAEEAEPQPKRKVKNPFTVAEVQIIKDNHDKMSVGDMSAMMQGNGLIMDIYCLM
jgi:hypothetical protein